MKLKCPGCSKLLQVPDSAAGKTVKCPCGKQLRVPSPKGAAPTPAAARSAPASARPAAPVRRPQAAASPLGADAGLFDELTETDLAPVAVVAQPGMMPTASSGGGHNPYATSLDEGSNSASAGTGNYASQNQRALNYFLDGIFLPMFMGGGGVVLGLLAPLFLGREPNENQMAIFLVIAYTLFFGMFLIYYVAFEAIFGATIAKFMTGTRVVSVDGGKAGFGKILGRTLARMLPFEPISFLIGDKQVGWHDTLSGTRVIDIRKS
ncbi:MAG: RDD family protein [Rhodopirellula sp. JB055]|uniref:RDD family protein n=1 Tax=Rhodopirellula sp. JB055 TaxID=3342846 RepID=UPI00370C4654